MNFTFIIAIMQAITELLKIFIPAAAVLYGMYLTMQTFLQKQFEQKTLEFKAKDSEIIIPVRLQAYERMILFLERITPDNLLIRLYDSETQSIDYQRIILNEIRQEFNHNLAQQMYVSHQAWKKIQKAMNDVVALVNTSAAEVAADATGINLSKKIFEKILTENQQPTAEAIIFLKTEVQTLFF